jgi:hypothetical protein
VVEETHAINYWRSAMTENERKWELVMMIASNRKASPATAVAEAMEIYTEVSQRRAKAEAQVRKDYEENVTANIERWKEEYAGSCKECGLAWKASERKWGLCNEGRWYDISRCNPICEECMVRMTNWANEALFVKYVDDVPVLLSLEEAIEAYGGPPEE